MNRLIAITGGIGSGKSVVSSLLRVMGYDVYDCDANAKLLVDSSPEIFLQIRRKFGENIADNGVINRQNLASIVFNDKHKLNELNEIIHPAVKEDIKKWANLNSDKKVLFIETAILKESNISSLVDYIVEVTAPKELRISRVMKRNNISRKDVEARINNQRTNDGKANFRIENDNKHSLISQMLSIMNKIH